MSTDDGRFKRKRSDCDKAASLTVEYYIALEQRLLAIELNGKKPSPRLLRQIFPVASFAAVVLGVINDARSPLAIRWISDRDAMFDRHGGIIFDLAWIPHQQKFDAHKEVRS